MRKKTVLRNHNCSNIDDPHPQESVGEDTGLPIF